VISTTARRELGSWDRRRSAVFCKAIVTALGIALALSAPIEVEARAVQEKSLDAEREERLKAHEKELTKLEKKYEKELKRCREGDRRGCDRAKLSQANIEEVKRALAALQSH